MPSVSTSALPEFIGRFRVISELGKGSQGIVYLASDTQLERNVAIKTILLEKPSAQVKQQLLKESRTVGKLQHPNIITLFEADEDNGKPYLVFEYVDGRTLREYLRKTGRIPAKDAINFLDPILNAIAYAHKLGIIHRDLSPHNIMLTAGNDVPRLMDFGIATLMGNPTEDGIWGTLNYLSPEQCNNKKVIAASDIFTLGLILYEMIVGKPAIDGDNKFAIINKILNEEINYPKDIDPGLKPIIQKALEKNPDARYGDALDMRQDLLDLLEKIAPENSNNKTKAAENTNTTIQFLLRRMEQKKDFPTMSHQVVEVSQKAQANSDSSANILSNAILKDYSLSTKLLRLVNSPMYSGYGGRISTVSRAVVILGFEEVRNAALGLMLLDHLKDKNQANSLKEACIESMISGSIANDLAKKLKIKDTEEAYVCSMFHRLGKLLAIYYFPEEMEIILDHVKRKGMKEDHAVQSVLSVSFEEIGIAVGEAWELPSEIVESMRPLPPGEVKKPLTQIDTLKHVASFSNEYTDLISITKAGERGQAFDNLAARFSNTMSISRGEMEEILSNSIAEMEKYAKLVDLNLKDSAIFKKANSWIPQKQEQTKDTLDEVSAEQEKAKSEEEDRRDNIIHAIQEITDTILENGSFNDILVMVMETIYSGFGFSRVMFCFINRSRTSIDARFGFGSDAETIINRLSIPLGGDKDIFNQALKQHKDLIINDINDDKNENLIPAWYRKEYSKKSMLVYPIVVKNIPLGLLYIDSVTPASFCDDTQLSLIKTLRNQITLAIRLSSSK